MAIKQLKGNSSPDNDGFPNDYKVFSKDLMEPLTTVLNHILENGVMPLTWSQSLIVVIPKEEKDQLDLASNQPNALMQRFLQKF